MTLYVKSSCNCGNQFVRSDIECEYRKLKDQVVALEKERTFYRSRYEAARKALLG